MTQKTNWIKRCLLFIPALIFGASLYAQDMNVTGVVTDSQDREPIPGVSVVIKGTTTGTVTDMNGEYKVTASQGSVLIFSFVGLKSQEFTVTKSTIDVALESDVIGMDEVVVTALGIKREEKSLGYSVTEVGTESLATGRNLNSVASNLSGKVSGVQVTNSSAGPGASTRIIIRGNSSMASNNQPLYVIDGVPTTDYTIGEAGDGMYGNGNNGSAISDLNQDDIESMSILKGANAAALYGSRASNGVVLITTKKGKNSGLGVSYSFSYIGSSALELPDFQNEYGQGRDGVLLTDLDDVQTTSTSWGAKMEGQDFLYFDGTTQKYLPQPDNIEDFFVRGDYYINTVSITGGNERNQSYFSYTSKSNSGITPNNSLNNHNFNFRNSFKIGKEGGKYSDIFSLDSKVTLLLQEVEGRQAQGASVGPNSVYQLFRMPRSTVLSSLVDTWDDDTNTQITYNPKGAYPNNPYWISNNQISEDKKQHLTAFTKLKGQFTDELSAFVRIGYDNIEQEIRSIKPWGDLVYPLGTYSNKKHNYTEVNADFLASYDKKIDQWWMNFNAGGSILYNESSNIGVSGEDQINVLTPYEDRGYFINNYAITNTSEKLPSRKQLNSVYATASLGYNDMVYLDLSARNDWSSTLPSNNRSYFYPSASLSLLLNEAFDLDPNLFSYLKLRGGYAIVGKDASNFSTEPYYTVSSEGVVSPENIRINPNLKPERTNSVELGLEFKMFNNRVYGDVTYYSTTSKDQIFSFTPSSTSGYTSAIDNAASISNRGIELLLGGTPISNSNFTWDISANLAQNKNVLEEFYEDITQYIYYNGSDVKVVNQVGEDYGVIIAKTYKTTDDGKRVVNDTGEYILTDDYEIGNSYLPDFTAGLTNTMSYKSIAFSFLIDGSFGGERYNRTQHNLTTLGVTEESLGQREAFVIPNTVYVDTDGNETVNSVSITPESYYGSLAPTDYISDATSVMLRQMSLSYTISNSLLKKTPIKSASVSLTGNNLFFIYNAMPGYDPLTSESTGNKGQGIISYNAPTTRNVGFNLKLTL